MAEVPGNMEAAGSFTGEIDASWFTGDIVVKEGPDGGFTLAFGVENKEPAGSFTGEIGVPKVRLRNKEAAAGSFTDEIGVTKGQAWVTEASWSWIDYVILYEKEQPLLAPKQGREAKPTGTMITKERVPDSFLKILLNRRPFNKHPPLTDEYSNFLSKYNPKLRELWLIEIARRNCCVDLHVDILRQHSEKGFAEVGVDFTGDVKKIYVLP